MLLQYAKGQKDPFTTVLLLDEFYALLPFCKKKKKEKKSPCCISAEYSSDKVLYQTLNKSTKKDTEMKRHTGE